MSGSIASKKLLVANQSSKERNYWLQKLKGELTLTRFPIDQPINNLQKRVLNFLNFSIKESIFSRLIELSNGFDYTLHMILMASYIILLHRYTGNDDIIVATPVYTQEKAGEYINTVLALRNQIKPEMTFKDLLLHVRQNMIEAVENQNYPLETLIYKLNLSEQGGGLFDTALLLNNIHDEKYIQDLNLNTILYFDRDESSIKGTLAFNSVNYRKSTIERIIQHYIVILETAISNIDMKINKINILSKEEEDRLFNDFNDTQVDIPENQTVCQLFEMQAAINPNCIALVLGETQLSYRELNEKANQLARLLKSRGIKRNDLVGLMVETSLEIGIGILGIMKAGAAYLPIDPTYPEQRIKYMLEDSQINTLLTQKHVAEENNEILNNSNLQMVFIDDYKNYLTDPTNLSLSKSENLAYVIYTSGSTGKPKGVMITHSSIFNTIYWRKNEYKLTFKDKVLQLFSFSFDGFVTSFFTPLTSGSQLFLIDNTSIKDPHRLREVIVKKKINHFLATPALYSVLLSILSQDDMKSLKIVTLAGEKVSNELVKRSKEKNKDIELVNEYGPTENSVATTCKRNLQNNDLTIGKPISNTQVYVMDQQMNIVPIGIIGELCISGKGLARGYLNQPELTKKCFLKNPFSGEKMYKTGDLVKWLPNGELEFIGRKDQQVKIRGFRVELEEIERNLAKHPLIKDVVVIAKEDNQNRIYLVAYFILEEDVEKKDAESMGINDWKEYLLKMIPDFMIPQFFVNLKELPVLPSGKVDLRSLPEPEVARQVEYVAPTNEIEEKLVNIWAEVLEIAEDKIGIDNNFFDMGGHSLKATIFVTKLLREMNVQLQIREVFEAPKIRELAKIIRTKEASNYSSIQPIAEERETYPLSSAQRRLFIVEQLESIKTAYNTPVVLFIDGELDVKQMEIAFQKFIARHEALRTSFEFENGKPVQRIHQTVNFKIDYRVCESIDGNVEGLVKDFVRPFDLSRAPLLRTEIIRLPVESDEQTDRYLFILDMHHIVNDGISMAILVKEIVDLYQGKELDKLRLHYKDFAAWQNKLFESEEMRHQEEYWLNQFQGDLELLKLPTDYSRPAYPTFEGSSVKYSISKNLVTKLKEAVFRNDVTLYIILLAVYNVLLSKYSGQEDIIIGSPITGRSHPDLENIMGMFVNMLCMRNKPKGELKFREFLQEVKKNAFDAFENQDYQYENLVKKLGLKRNTNQNPLFNFVFAFENISIKPIKSDKFVIRPCEVEFKLARFDLLFDISEVNDELKINVDYKTSLFKEKTVKKIIENFVYILRQVLENKNILLKDIIIYDTFLKAKTEDSTKKIVFDF